MRWTAGLEARGLLHKEVCGRLCAQRVSQVLGRGCFQVLFAYDFHRPLSDLRNNNWRIVSLAMCNYHWSRSALGQL